MAVSIPSFTRKSSKNSEIQYILKFYGYVEHFLLRHTLFFSIVCYQYKIWAFYCFFIFPSKPLYISKNFMRKYCTQEKLKFVQIITRNYTQKVKKL